MSASGFWGLIVEPGKMYSQSVPSGFKITMASLGPEESEAPAAANPPAKGSAVSRTTLMVRMDENDDYALCSLMPGKIEQQRLDLVFTEGENIAFRLIGSKSIHLSGYYIVDQPSYMDDEDDDECDEYEEEFTDDDDEEEDDEDDEEIDSDDSDFDESSDSRIKEINSSDEEEEDNEEEESEEEEEKTIASKRAAPAQAAKNTKQVKIAEEVVKTPAKAETSKAATPAQNQQKSTPAKSQPESKPATPKVEQKSAAATPKAEQKKADTPKAEQKSAAATPKAEQKKVETPKAEQKKVDTPKAEQKKVETPKAEQKKAETPKAKDAAPANELKSKVLPSGLTIEDVKLGDGVKAQSGRRVGITYRGMLADGTVFDSNKGKDLLYFTLGKQEVIKGMEIGIQGMSIGGERKLVIPSALAYGQKGAPPTIPKNATLTFEIKLEKVAVKNK